MSVATPAAASPGADLGLPHTLELNRSAVDGRCLFFKTCPHCGQAGASHVVGRTLRALPDWLLAHGALLYLGALALAARAPDFAWYHSATEESRYRPLLELAVAWPLLFPAAAGLLAGAVWLAVCRPVRLKTTVCRDCAKAHDRAATARTLTAVVAGPAAIFAVAATQLLGGHYMWTALAPLPVLLLVLALRRHADRGRAVQCDAVRGGLVRLTVPSAWARTLLRERPALAVPFEPRPTSLRRVSAVAAACASALAFMLVADEGTFVCPPDTQGHALVGDDGVQTELCFDDKGELHGRYLKSDKDGTLLESGGFDRGFPSGTWMLRDDDGEMELISPLDPRVRSRASVFAGAR
jgi:hypothetical protein